MTGKHDVIMYLVQSRLKECTWLLRSKMGEEQDAARRDALRHCVDQIDAMMVRLKEEEER